MKKFIGIIILVFVSLFASAQSTIFLRGDTVSVTKQGGSSELKIMNATRDSISGVLVNRGNGVTKFQKIRAINDSMFVVGTDTVKIKGTGGGGGGTVTSITAGTALTGGTITTSGTINADTGILSTKLYSQKILNDSSFVLRAAINTKGNGTVTSVATGYGLSGGTITSTGTLIADTAAMATRERVQKQIDSLSSVSASAAGSNREVQYNNSGSFGASANMTYNSTSGKFTLQRPTGQDSSIITLDNQTAYIGEKKAITIKAPLKNDSTPDFHITSNLAANGDDTRSNHVVKMGFNYFNQHPTFGSNFTAMEGNWIDGGTKNMEYHYQVKTAGELEQSRLFSSTFRLADSLKRSFNIWDFRGTSFVWQDLENNGKFSISSPNGLTQSTTVAITGAQPVFAMNDAIGDNGFIQYANGQFGTNRAWTFNGHDVNGMNLTLNAVGGASGTSRQFFSTNTGVGMNFIQYGLGFSYLSNFYAGAFQIFSSLSSNSSIIRNNGNWIINDPGTGVETGQRFQVYGSGYFNDTLIANTKFKILSTPTNNDTTTQILTRDFTTGEIKYRNASTISGGGGTVTNVATGNGLSGGPITTTGTLVADTLILSTKNNTQKVVNDSSFSIRALVNTKGTGTVTSVSPGYGTNFTTITSSGSIDVDTLFISSKFNVQKIVNDTAFAIRNSIGNYTTAANGLNKFGTDIRLGGTLSQRTIITGAGFGTVFTDTLSTMRQFRVMHPTSTVTPNALTLSMGAFNDSSSLFMGWNVGKSSSADAKDNILIGTRAGEAITTGGLVLGIGSSSLRSFATGNFSSNQGVGHNTLRDLTVGSSNNANGASSMLFRQSGSFNSAFGTQSIRTARTGDFNTAMGANSFGYKAGGSANVAIGYEAMKGDNIPFITSDSISDNNTAIGHQSLLRIAQGDRNVAIGYQAGLQNRNGNDLLYISNDSSEASLIKGDFAADTLRINGKFSISTVDSVNTPQNMLYITQEGRIQKAAVPVGGGSGTVTSVATGFGLSGGTITTTGTIIADSAAIATRARVQKGIDSLGAIKQNNITLTTTGTSGAATFIGDVLNIPVYPSGGGTTETASNGLTKVGNDIRLGGTITANTTVAGSGGVNLTLGGYEGGMSNVILEPTAAIQLNGALVFGRTITPAALTAEAADWAPTDISYASRIEASSNSGTQFITGVIGGINNREITIENVGTSLLKFQEGGASTAANQFELGSIPHMVLIPGAAATFRYKTSNSRWNLKHVTDNDEIASGNLSPSSFLASYRNEGISVTTDQWISTQVTGTGAANNSTGVTAQINRPGIIQATTGTTATGRAYMATINMTQIVPDPEDFIFYETSVRIGTLSSGTDSFTVRAGLLDVVTGDPSDGVFFRYSHTAWGGNWAAVARANNVETNINTTQAAAGATWTKLAIVVTGQPSAPGTAIAKFYINGTEVASTTSTVPIGAARVLGFGNGILKGLGVTARTLDTDYFNFKHYISVDR